MKKYCLGLLIGALAMGSAVAATYPDLPVAMKEGGGALLGDTAYVGLGSAGDQIYRLNLKQPQEGWQALPAFPGGERAQPVIAAVNGKLYVFGGLQKNAQGAAQLINDAHVYDPATQTWQQLPTRSPLGLVGTTPAVHGGRVYMIGGSNLSIFNGYLRDYTAADADHKDAIAAAYFNQRPQDYFFNTTLFSYDPSNNRWYNDGALPFAGRAGAAVAVNGDSIVVANGEIKPGLRTDAVEVGTFNGDGSITWQSIAKLISPDGHTAQDGLAGAYSGFTHGYYLLAGGANFPGARQQFADGELFAHKGLKKTHHAEIYTLSGGDPWQVIGQLPQGAAYGVTISYDGKLLLIGGATDSDTLKSVTVLDYDGKHLTIE